MEKMIISRLNLSLLILNILYFNTLVAIKIIHVESISHKDFNICFIGLSIGIFLSSYFLFEKEKNGRTT